MFNSNVLVKISVMGFGDKLRVELLLIFWGVRKWIIFWGDWGFVFFSFFEVIFGLSGSL